MTDNEIPKCSVHHVSMVKHQIKSQIFGNMIPIWKCPECDYMEYRSD
jgi:hypothetical protein